MFFALLLLACAPEAPHPANHGAVPQVAARAAPPAPPPGDVGVTYRVDLTSAHTGMVRVTATLPVEGASDLVLFMPTWTPGSYLVREYARHVEGVEARGADGEPVPVAKVSKNRWRVETGGQPHVEVAYALWARELSVRSNHVDADRAILNGAATFLVPVDRTERPLDVALVLPDGWLHSETSLTPHPDGTPHRYLARDLDELVDAPVVAGDLVVQEFVVEGVPHRLVDVDGMGVWDSARAAADVERVTQAIADFWGFVPYPHYRFLNVLGDGRGGLEHLDSTLLMARRGASGDEAAWKDWLGLVSHELFHAWNVKRMRPRGLGPFDYEGEVYTPSLWVAEGLTSYYDDLLLVRGGLLDGKEHLGRLSDAIGDLQGRPGRLVQSLSASSFDAWIEHYRPDAHSVNSAVSYYRKGALVGWLLDVEIRRASGDRGSLDDVLRALYATSLEDGYAPADVVAAASEAAGEDLSPFFAAYVDGTDELDYGLALAWLGLRFAAPPEAEPTAWLGLSTSGGQVTQVVRGTPVWDAGVEVGDEVVAVEDWRFSERAWAEVRRRYVPGDAVELVVARKGKLRRLPAILAAEPVPAWTVEVDPTASTAATLRRERWWGQR